MRRATNCQTWLGSLETFLEHFTVEVTTSEVSALSLLSYASTQCFEGSPTALSSGCCIVVTQCFLTILLGLQFKVDGSECSYLDSNFLSNLSSSSSAFGL